MQTFFQLYSRPKCILASVPTDEGDMVLAGPTDDSSPENGGFTIETSAHLHTLTLGHTRK